MPYKDKKKRTNYQREFMRGYRKKEREYIKEYKKMFGITNGRKKKSAR